MKILNSCDALDASRFNTGTGVNNPTAADTDIKVQGTASWRARVTGASLGGFGDDFGGSSSLVGGDHVMIWCRTLDIVSAADGWRMRLSTGADTASNYREISVGNLNTSRNVVLGFFNFCGDPLHPQMNQNGTPPTLANTRSFSLLANHTTSSGRDTMFMDEIKHGTGITVTGGAAAPRGSVEIAASDGTNGRGTFADITGVYYILGRLTIGDITAAVNSTFEDSNKVWNFQAGSFSPSFHKIEFVGGTGTNAATLGSVSGTGVNEAGSGGNTILAAGLVPFHIFANDADIAVGLYGCVLLGPAARYSAPFRAVVEGTASDQTFAASNTVDTDANLLAATQALNSACHFGSEVRFGELSIDAAALATGTWTLTWEYWDGSSWIALGDVTDGTAGFRTAGEQTVTFSIPDNWATTTINSQGPFYYIRARISAFTSSGVRPTADFIRIHQDGLVELTVSTAKMISSTLTNMGSVMVRGGAFLKKSSISGSIAPAKHAALDLGSTDPAADTVRDLTIQNCTKGVLLQDYTRFFDAGAAVDKGAGKVGIPSTAHGFPTGQEILIAGTTNYNGVQTVDATSSANEIVITDTFAAETFAITDSAVPNTTFNIRAFSFSGNTNDFRVDFPATSTVVINLLESTTSDTALTPANQDNVNTSTLSLIAAVTLAVTVTDSAGAVVEGARARIENASTGALITQGETNASGVYSFSYNYTGDLAVRTKVRLKGFKPFRTLGTILSTGISVGATLQSDTIVDLP